MATAAFGVMMFLITGLRCAATSVLLWLVGQAGFQGVVLSTTTNVPVSAEDRALIESLGWSYMPPCSVVCSRVAP